MDIKRIDQLPEAASPQGSDLIPLWQETQTTKVKLESIQASGPAGKDGVSPTVEVSKSGTQTTITITDAQGKHTSTINDGAPGKDGTPGTPGKDGAKGDPGDTWVPSYDAESGDLTWGKNTGEAPGTMNIRGPKGEAGTPGKDGVAGKDGAPGKDGAKGDPGDPGEDGFSPTVKIEKVGKTTTITITDKQGAHVATIEDGADGEGGGGSAYTLPVASAETLGGVKAKAKTEAETVEVAVDAEGKLYVPAASSGGGDSYTLPVASANAIGGVKGPAKTNAETEQVHIDDEGKMWVKPSGGGGSSEALTMTLNVEIKGGTSAAVTVTAQSIHRMLRVGDVIDTTLTITDNEYLIKAEDPYFDGNLLFNRAYGEVRAVSEERSGKKAVVIVFTTYSASSVACYSADVTSFLFQQAADGFTLGNPTSSPAHSSLLTPRYMSVRLEEALPLDGTNLYVYYERDGTGRLVFKDADGVTVMQTIQSENSLSALTLPFCGDISLMHGNIRLQVQGGVLHYTSEAGSGNGVSLYVVNQTVGNVDFSRYKAGDVVLLVQDLVVTKEE